MEKRRFNTSQRTALYLASGGVCEKCGKTLQPGWHADHMYPWSGGGQTDVINGQALCPTCNLKKGGKIENMETTLSSEWPEGSRDWHFEAWEKYLSDNTKDWLLCATPGAGKTQWALYLARYLLDHNMVKRVVIVTPTQTVRDQWVEYHDKQTREIIVNLTVVENGHGGIENREDFEGIVVTYAQVANQPDLQRKGCQEDTLVIFDEVHHAGFPNRSWGTQAQYAFERSIRRIGLTGTPWRRPGSGQIPFVTYDLVHDPDRQEQTEKVRVSYAYEYGRAVSDEVCRSIEFRAFDGEVKYTYLDSCGQRNVVYTLEDEDDNTTILRDLLKADGAWIHSILEMAHQELINIRRGDDGESAIPDAKGLVVADTQGDARIISNYLEKLTKEKPELIISDEVDSEQALERFRAGTGMWAVAVNKVSEGVDVPALYVGVYATRKKTPMIFRQIVGRFVRRRVDEFGKPRIEEERSAVLFMPAVPTLKELASQIEQELRHQADIEQEEYERERIEQGKLGFDDDLELTEDIEAIPTDTSSAELDSVIVAGKVYSKTEYSHAQTLAEQFKFRSDEITKLADLLREMGMTPPKSTSTPPPRNNAGKTTPHKYKKSLLRQVEQLARKKALALHIEHKDFNKDLLKRFGPRRKLSIKQLEDLLQWLNQLNADSRAKETV